VNNDPKSDLAELRAIREELEKATADGKLFSGIAKEITEAAEKYGKLPSQVLVGIAGGSIGTIGGFGLATFMGLSAMICVPACSIACIAGGIVIYRGRYGAAEFEFDLIKKKAQLIADITEKIAALDTSIHDEKTRQSLREKYLTLLDRAIGLEVGKVQETPRVDHGNNPKLLAKQKQAFEKDLDKEGQAGNLDSKKPKPAGNHDQQDQNGLKEPSGRDPGATISVPEKPVEAKSSNQGTSGKRS
jgi:hypothetical protein